MTKLLVLPSMDPWSASTRYRASQHVPRLRQHFASVAISYPNDTVVRHPGRINRVRYFGGHSRRYMRRGITVSRRLQSADALLVQRGLYVMGPGPIVHPIEAFAGRVVFDLDDALFRLSPSLAAKSRAAQWLYGPHQALRLLRRADGDVPHRMRHGDSPLFRAVLELLVTSLMRNFVPAVFPQTLDDLTAAHALEYTLLTHQSTNKL